MTTEYEQMTDDDLRYLIAQRLGWKGVHQSYGKFAAVPPNAKPGSFVELPNWVSDCNAAMALLKDMSEYVLQWSAICLQWRVRPIAGVMNYAIAAHETPARAICIAWLLWQDAQEAE